MVNQFEEFSPAASDTTADNLSGARAQQYLPEAAIAMSPSNTAGAFLPDVSIGFGPVSAADGPRPISDNSINGRNPISAPAELGNAHHIVELITKGGFQNPDGTITAAGQESIRAAVAAAGSWAHTWNPLQSYEDRTQQVQDYINRHVRPAITLSFDRDTANTNTAQGARPFISIGTNAGTRIPLRP